MEMCQLYFEIINVIERKLLQVIWSSSVYFSYFDFILFKNIDKLGFSSWTLSQYDYGVFLL